MGRYRIRWVLRLCLLRGSDCLIQFNDIFTILADSFFNGDTAIAGVIVLVAILAFVMAFSKKLVTTLIIAVPIVMIFAYLAYIPQEIGLIMLLIISLAIAFETRGVFD